MRKNELLKYHNDLADLKLTNFQIGDLNILEYICFCVMGKEDQLVEIDLKELRKKTKFKHISNTEFIEYIDNLSDKLMEIKWNFDNKERKIKTRIFPRFEFDKEFKSMYVKVEKDFIYLFNKLSKNFTTEDLNEYLSLKTAYSKKIYRKLRKFLSTGIWIIGVEDIRKELDIPSSYNNTMIENRIIKPTIEELKQYFKGLKYEKIYEKSSEKRGRKSIKTFRFSFAKKNNKKNNDLTDIQRIAISQEYSVKPVGICPRCKKPIYERPWSFEDRSDGIMIAHPDWKTGECDWKTSDRSKVTSFEEYRKMKEKEKEENLTEEQKKEREENIKKLEEIVGNTFK